MIIVDRGNGEERVETWSELWAEMWRAVSFAIHFKAHGECICGCEIADCYYCVGECFI